MQKERLIIKNFFTLKDVDIELGKYNVFIGEQANGKSLLIKLAYFFRNILRLPITNYLSSEEQITGYVIAYFREILRLESSMPEKLQYYIEYQFNDGLKIFIKYMDNNLNVNISDKLRNIYEISRNKLINIQQLMAEQNTHPANLQYGIMQANVSQVLKESIFGETSLALFFPAGRTFLVSLQRNLFNTINTMNADSKLPSIDPLLLLFGQQYQGSIDVFGSPLQNNILIEKQKKITDFFDELSLKILKGNFINDGFGGYITQMSGDVRPWNSSSGQQEFLPVFLVLRNYLLSQQRGFLYLEEPEAHLYPSAQKAITELLVYVTNATNSDGLYITTHSPYILTVLNNLILANDVKDKQTLFDKDLLVPFEEVRAYFIADGVARDLRDHENRLILADNLDKVSEQTALDFDKLLDMKYE